MAGIGIGILHLGICFVLTRIYRTEKLLWNDNLLPMVYLLPCFGAICFLMRRKQLLDKRTLGVEVEYHDKDVLRGKYAKIEVEDEDELSSQVVPLEEALLLNDATVRHNLMLNILHKNPGEYLEMLQKARNSEDTEVTHYATTMMMEILSEYEKEIQYYDREYQKKPDDRTLLRKYIRCMQDFIHSKLVTGNIEKVYRQKLAQLLEQYLEDANAESEAGIKKPGSSIFISIENYLFLGEYEKAREQLVLARQAYPEDERMFRLYGHYYDSVGEYAKLKELVQYIKDNKIYMSHEGKAWLAFWS